MPPQLISFEKINDNSRKTLTLNLYVIIMAREPKVVLTLEVYSVYCTVIS
jgi:hypothetical protein